MNIELFTGLFGSKKEEDDIQIEVGRRPKPESESYLGYFWLVGAVVMIGYVIGYLISILK